MSMVRGRSTGGDEVRPALADGLEIALPGRDVASREFAQFGQVGLEAGPIRIDDVVGTKGRDDPTGPLRAAQPAWAASGSSAPSVVARNSIPKRSKSARGRNSSTGEARGKVVVQVVGGCRAERFVNFEDGSEGVVQPELRRCAREQMVVLGELPPDLAPVHGGRPAVHRFDAERLEANTLAVHEAEQVMVPGHQLECRVAAPLRPRPAGSGCSDHAGSRSAVPSSPRRGVGPCPEFRVPRGRGGLDGARLQSFAEAEPPCQVHTQTPGIPHTCDDSRVSAGERIGPARASCRRPAPNQGKGSRATRRIPDGRRPLTRRGPEPLMPSRYSQRRAGVAEGMVRLAENAHDAGEESSYHASPVY